MGATDRLRNVRRRVADEILFAKHIGRVFDAFFEEGPDRQRVAAHFAHHIGRTATVSELDAVRLNRMFDRKFVKPSDD